MTARFMRRKFFPDHTHFCLATWYMVGGDLGKNGDDRTTTEEAELMAGGLEEYQC